MKKNNLRRHKWHKTREVESPGTDEEVHVWGVKIGRHRAWHDGEVWYAFEEDPFDVEGISHFHLYPNDPRPGRR